MTRADLIEQIVEAVYRGDSSANLARIARVGLKDAFVTPQTSVAKHYASQAPSGTYPDQIQAAESTFKKVVKHNLAKRSEIQKLFKRDRTNGLPLNRGGREDSRQFVHGLATNTMMNYGVSKGKEPPIDLSGLPIVLRSPKTHSSPLLLSMGTKNDRRQVPLAKIGQPGYFIGRQVKHVAPEHIRVVTKSGEVPIRQLALQRLHGIKSGSIRVKSRNLPK